MLRDPLDLTSRPPVIGRVATATITLVCVLIVYDGWASLRFLDVVLIIFGPILAIFTSHVFSTTLVRQVELGRLLTRSEWFSNVRFESRFLLLGVPPIAILAVLMLANVSLEDAVRVVIWVEALSLAFWAGLAAWLIGLRGRALMLQPGKAAEGGTVLGPRPQAGPSRR